MVGGGEGVGMCGCCVVSFHFVPLRCSICCQESRKGEFPFMCNVGGYGPMNYVVPEQNVCFREIEALLICRGGLELAIW